MEYIGNHDLREWVKKSLRKALFQKAHELSVQTGCEILLRVQDVSVPESLSTQYYATPSVQKTYENNKLQKRPGEVLISGETGLPAKRKIDRGIQMSDGSSDTTSFPSENNGNQGNDDAELMQSPFVQDSGISTDVDMQNQNTEDTDTNGEILRNHLESERDDKIDLTQDSDSDDSIVEVGEVKEEPGAHRELFKQEQGYTGGQTDMYTHPTPYQCAVCQKAFANVQMLENHNKLEHAGGVNDGVVAMTAGSGVAPMATESGVQQQQDAMVAFKLEPNSYTCIRCQTPFNDSALLHNHMTQCHMTNIPTSSFGSPSHLRPQFSSATSPVRPAQGIPSAAGSPHPFPAASGSPHSFQAASGSPHSFPASSGSPLPQITSVTSLKLMPGGMSVSSAPSSPMVSASSTSSFHSPQSTRSLPSQSPLSTRSLPSPAASPRGRKRLATHGQGLSPHADMSKRTLMAALLQVAGPLAIYPVVRQNWQFLRMLTKKQFQMAAAELQHMNLGRIINVPNYRGTAFLKPTPESAQQTLMANPDLCEAQYYTIRYNQSKSRSIPAHLWTSLTSMGLVPSEESTTNNVTTIAHAVTVSDVHQRDFQDKFPKLEVQSEVPSNQH